MTFLCVGDVFDRLHGAGKVSCSVADQRGGNMQPSPTPLHILEEIRALAPAISPKVWHADPIVFPGDHFHIAVHEKINQACPGSGVKGLPVVACPHSFFGLDPGEDLKCPVPVYDLVVFVNEELGGCRDLEKRVEEPVPFLRSPHRIRALSNVFKDERDAGEAALQHSRNEPAFKEDFRPVVGNADLFLPGWPAGKKGNHLLFVCR